MSAELSELCPVLQKMVPVFLEQCASKGLVCRITVTWRSNAEQAAVKKKGLSKAGAGQSPHNCMINGKPSSKAFDFALFDKTRYITDGSDERYTQAGIIAETLGLLWGGRWRKPDYDHVELANWKKAPGFA